MSADKADDGNGFPVERIGAPLDDNDLAGFQMMFEFLKPLAYQVGEQNNGMGRWLLATMVVVNGGALIAAVNSDEISGPLGLFASGLWLLGLVLAILSAFHALQSGLRGQAVIMKMIKTLVEGMNARTLPDLRFNKERAKMEGRGKITVRIGLASLVCFIVGAIIVATAFILEPQPVIRY